MLLPEYAIMLSENRAQISIEMIIIFAAVVAIVSLVLSNLINTTNQGKQAVERETQAVLDLIEDL